ncbi:UPF0280 family protein [Aquabacterium sp. OR-4]|uniref:UPF0280 family protein n=1 Tax=Aquabacterium sp. OR-4 TaxID=2978127 RepID=UPI0021B246D0|nr:UPF0280 family protein [Aquabacterium sp. OR-4]MDT7836226.1 UPF0280 family protein [Aquabacterium sp. OR-4]
MSAATRAALADGRWHFQHGPIDLVLAANGEPAAVAAAHAQAWARFQPLLAELVAELPLLRQPLHSAAPPRLRGAVAQRMVAACLPFAGHIVITPMAAVAGAVAQEIVAAYQRPGIRRAWVNNGGDIALHLAAGSEVSVGLYADLARLDAAAVARTVAGQGTVDGRFTVHAHSAVRGVATSGWRGRSFSLGIADSVTVLAATAAQADAAATVIANAVNVDHPGIVRCPARALRDDSDLGEILVTTAVPPLPPDQVRQALAAGLRCARALQGQGLIAGAALVCQGSLARSPETQPLQCVA